MSEDERLETFGKLWDALPTGKKIGLSFGVLLVLGAVATVCFRFGYNVAKVEFANPPSFEITAEPGGSWQEFDGTGSSKTEPFDAEWPWTLRWTKEWKALITVSVHRAQDGKMLDLIVHDADLSTGNARCKKTGKLFLRVSTLGPWHVEVSKPSA